MNKHKSVPNIRFKGFEDKWTINRLLSITTVYSGLTYKPEDTQPFGTLVLRSSNIQEGKIIKKDCVYVNSSVVNSINVEKKDVILVVRNGSKKLIGKHAIVMHNMKDTVIGAFMSGLRPKNGDFLNALLSTETFKKEVFRSLGATINQITNKDLKRMKFYLPFNYEQQKIGDFFTKLDKLLDLQQQKINKLELLKKALLQKLFPKHDAQIPELRFKGFYNKWERTTISEMGKVTTGNTPSTKQKRYYSKMGIPWITPSNIDKNGNLYNVKYLSKDGAKIGRIVPKGSVLVTSIASIGKNTLLKEDSAFNQQINAITPKKKYNSYFLYTACNQLSKEMKVIASAGTMQIVNKKEFSKMLINCPLLPEQQKIGNLLSKVDRLIELENKKLHNLQQVKKCLLQNMFVE